MAAETAPSPPGAETPALPPLVSVVLLALLAGSILFLIPRPAAVSVQGWRMLAIFVCTIAAMILRPVPGGAAVLIGVARLSLDAGTQRRRDHTLARQGTPAATSRLDNAAKLVVEYA